MFPEMIAAVQNEIGESPVWVEEENAVYWVDTEHNSIFKYNRGHGSFDKFEVDMPVTAMHRRALGGWILVTKKGLAFWDGESETCTFIVDPVKDQPDLAFNDGVVDRQGRFLCGTMNCVNHINPDGCLYRLDTDGTLHTLDTGLSVANGIGVSLDGKTIYLSEQFKGRILAYDYDTENGTVSNKRTFAMVPETRGLPDGIIVDSEDFVWNAHWDGGRITRYNREGRVDREIRLPCNVVTCMTFGGEDLDELYITTGWYGMTKEERSEKALSGDLFKIKVDVKGMKDPQFKG